MTDETRLHGMMADPGPAPTHDTSGWPTDVAGLAAPPERAECADKLFEDCVDGGGYTSMYRVECPHGRWLGSVAGTAIARAERWHGFADTTAPPLPYHAPNLPAPAVTDAAGPASLSASTSGTGGLADTAAELAASAKDLAQLARDVREELEGRRREMWDELLSTARLAEIGSGRNSGQFLAGCKYFYGLATRTDGEELERRLAAELDARYGTDRAKGGEPRG